LAADEPLGERQLPVEDRVPLLEPVEQLRGLLRPEPLVVLVGLVVEERARSEAALLEIVGRREDPVFDEEVLDGGAAQLLVGRVCPLWHDLWGSPPRVTAMPASTARCGAGRATRPGGRGDHETFSV